MPPPNPFTLNGSHDNRNPCTMNGMADDDYYDVWLDMLGRTSRPDFVALILTRAGVTLDQQLCVYLVHLDLRGPMGVLELAELVDQNHPKVSRTLAKLED